MREADPSDKCGSVWETDHYAGEQLSICLNGKPGPIWNNSEICKSTFAQRFCCVFSVAFPHLLLYSPLPSTFPLFSGPSISYFTTLLPPSYYCPLFPVLLPKCSEPVNIHAEVSKQAQEEDPENLDFLKLFEKREFLILMVGKNMFWKVAADSVCKRFQSGWSRKGKDILCSSSGTFPLRV